MLGCTKKTKMLVKRNAGATYRNLGQASSHNTQDDAGELRHLCKILWLCTTDPLNAQIDMPLSKPVAFLYPNSVVKVIVM